MHEYSITENILSIVIEKAQEAGAEKVEKINLVVGELSGVVGECVEQYFSFMSRDTVAEGAEFVFEYRPIRLRCGNCTHEYTPAEDNWVCPECGEPGMDIISGRELFIESLEVD